MPVKLARYFMQPLTFLKAYMFLDRFELFSSHQSSLFLSIYLNTLHKTEEKAIGRKVMFELALGTFTIKRSKGGE